jgi:glutamate carboxypeptidase
MANAAGLSADELRVRDACSQRAAAMLNDLTHLVNTPTGPGSGDGLPALRDWFTRRLEAVGATTHQVPGDPKESWLEGPTARHGDGPSASVPPTLICRRRVAGAPSVLLCGHLDTVHEASSDFRSFTVDPSGKRATGPGCVDMKGGLVVALHALEALEASGIRVSWTFMLNSDEETGSYHSDAALRSEAAAGYTAGLVFEPAMTDGGLVTQRPGSGQFMIETTGRGGHVGRDFAQSVSAVTALAKCLVRVSELPDVARGKIASVGPLVGGSATNVVPDHAAAWGNVRFENPTIAEELAAELDALASGQPGQLPGIGVRRSFHRPAKPLTPRVERLALAAREVAESLGQRLPFGKTGGVCDGNNMQAVGLATIDTLGVRGGGLHTRDEWMEIPSLVERSQLAAVLIGRICRGVVEL